jgi:rhodanese-related sulfurtransferase
MAIQHISATETKKLLQSDPGVHVWNVLSEEYYKGESIDGSRWIPVTKLAQAVKNASLSKDASIIVYCGSPECPASGKAAEELQKLGFKNVKAFEGGLKEWKALGYPVTHTDVANETMKCAAC